MKYFIQKLFLLVILLFCAAGAQAQIQWPSPEVAKMYRDAEEYMARENYKDAISILKQAISLAPGSRALYLELGHALYMTESYTEAEEVLMPLITNKGADVQCYALLAEVQAAKYNMKAALSTIQKGLINYPSSGILYNVRGKIFYQQKEPRAALNAWLDGIEHAASYAANYYDAAVTYLNTDKKIWGLLYGELYLSMAHDTIYDAALKSKLLEGYKAMFASMANGKVPQYGKVREQPAVNNFKYALQNIYNTLIPVVSDGITTETLTMLRVRFLMEWFSKYDKKYPFSFFAWQEKVIKSGRFDVYTEWLFGNAESVAQYKAWNEFHEGDMDRFKKWHSLNLFIPKEGEFYNDRDMEGLFGKKK